MGLPELRSPEAFAREVEQSIASSVKLIKRIEEATTAQKETIELLDRVSDTLCRVADSAEAVRSVHSDPRWSRAADDAALQMGSYLAQLNGYVPLYDAIRRLSDDAHFMGSLGEEEARLVHALKAEYEKDGIHLPEEGRQRVQQLKLQEVELARRFEENARSENATVEFAASDVAGLLAGIPGNAMTKAAGSVRLSLSSHVTNVLTSQSPLHHVREAAYRAGNAGAWSNLGVLEDLARTRLELARTIGFPSYADMAMSASMAQSRDEVDAQLRHLAASLQPLVEEEMGVLRSAKRRFTGSDDVYLWDVNFLMGVVHADQEKENRRAETTRVPLSGLVDALRLVCDRAFGVDLRAAPLGPGEGWVSGAHVAPMKLEVASAGGEVLGCVYLDAEPRGGKPPGAAHYTVRCGRRLTDEELAERAPDCAETGTYQVPRSVLALNMQMSRDGTGEVYLSPSGAETVFHEFGHALQAVLSRTRFQHFSGTRCAADFVEVPSHLMEKFLTDERVVEVATRGAAQQLPLARQHAAFGAFTQLQQIAYARFDLHVHGADPLASPLADSFDAVLAETLPLPPCRGTHWFTRFHHLCSYGGNYYSYVYGNVLSAALWQRCFSADPLSSDAGAGFRDAVLVHGGARDPLAMLRDAFGESRDVSMEAMLDGYIAYLARTKARAALTHHL